MDIKELSSWGISKAIYEIVENGFVVDEETGEVYFTADDLDALEATLDEKLESIMNIINKYNGLSEAGKQRKKDIEENCIKYYEKRAENLKKYLSTIMEMNNVEKKEYPDGRLSFRKSKSVEISDEDALMNFMENHPEYSKTCVKEEIKRSVVKAGLKDLISDGVKIPGASITENKNLIIK